MEKAIQASAVVEHAAHCDQPLQPKVLCYENNIRLRRIKEALYIRHTVTYNRDQGAEMGLFTLVPGIWPPAAALARLCHSIVMIDNRVTDDP
ncbi:hypothetical protein M514_09977 [Trichuris suis]|uniref:Uncharacterized protein n=1 Tax=Trichuris suis TaxID=68888 RepID=A0A085MY79_9BILA|nr:hypothetical protein M513_09977 [Trichuris suis]KFD62175.1 hypothetical protein M514_09977 [Trichuris suis]